VLPFGRKAEGAYRCSEDMDAGEFYECVDGLDYIDFQAWENGD
jgi:hypothetical protein